MRGMRTRTVSGALVVALCAAAGTSHAAPRTACPQLADVTGDVDPNVDPRQQPSSDLTAVSLAAGKKVTQVRVRLADLPDTVDAGPVGHTYDVYLRGRDHVYKVGITTANGSVRANLWQRQSASPAGDPEAALNQQGGDFSRVAVLVAGYDARRNHVQADVPWSSASDLDAGQVLDGLSASVFVKTTSEGTPASDRTHAFGTGAGADHAEDGEPYVVGARGCSAA